MSRTSLSVVSDSVTARAPSKVNLHLGVGPRRDDGYDIADYTQVLPEFGTLPDFQQLISEAHARGIRVIVDLVPNHTSDEHEWFQAALAAGPGSRA